MWKGCQTFDQFYCVWNLENSLESKRKAWSYLDDTDKRRLREYAQLAKERDNELF
jgi:hypothetical protein